jgi:hypothetical protein
LRDFPRKKRRRNSRERRKREEKKSNGNFVTFNDGKLQLGKKVTSEHAKERKKEKESMNFWLTFLLFCALTATSTTFLGMHVNMLITIADKKWDWDSINEVLEMLICHR